MKGCWVLLAALHAVSGQATLKLGHSCLQDCKTDTPAWVIGNYAEMSDDLHQLRERGAGGMLGGMLGKGGGGGGAGAGGGGMSRPQIRGSWGESETIRR